MDERSPGGGGVGVASGVTRYSQGKASRTFHTEFPEPLLHEIDRGINTENTERGGLPSLSVLRQFFFVPSVLLLIGRNFVARREDFFPLPLATSRLPLPARLVAAKGRARLNSLAQ